MIVFNLKLNLVPGEQGEAIPLTVAATASPSHASCVTAVTGQSSTASDSVVFL